MTRKDHFFKQNLREYRTTYFKDKLSGEKILFKTDTYGNKNYGGYINDR